MPKNILMIGATGVGKTEIARRLAKLANSPFLKVEASKFTEVGYVGRDVESIIRDLVDVSIDMVREERLEMVADRAEQQAEDRLLDLLMPPQPESAESNERTREKLREKLRAGKLDDRMVEVDVKERGPTFEVSTNGNLEEMDINLKDVIPGLFGARTRKRNMRVSEAFEYLIQEEEQKLWTWTRSHAWPWSVWSAAGSYFWTRSTKSLAAKADTDRMSAAKECSATFFRLWKGPA